MQAMLPGLQQAVASTKDYVVHNDDLRSENVKNASEEHVVDMVTSIIDNILQGEIPELLSREEKISKIKFMDSKGIFLMKGSIELVAARLGVNKVTVYSYLDEARGKR